VNREAYPDPTQFDPKSEGYDKAATETKPRWFTVDIRFVEKFAAPLTLTEIKVDKKFTGIEVARQGSRLSVQPVSATHFALVETSRSKK
jgi:predicted RNA-binding protein with PUA-like domain